LKGLLHIIFIKCLPLLPLLPTTHDLIQSIDLPVLLLPPHADERVLPEVVRSSLLPLLLLDEAPLVVVADILAVANLTLRAKGFKAYFEEMLEGGERRAGVGGVSVVLQATLRAYQRLCNGE